MSTSGGLKSYKQSPYTNHLSSNIKSASSSSLSSSYVPSTDDQPNNWIDSINKPRKPRLLRQSNAEFDVSPNRSSSGDQLDPTSAATGSSHKLNSVPRPVPQVSVTLSTPDGTSPFDDSTIEYIDSDAEYSLGDYSIASSTLTSPGQAESPVASETQSVSSIVNQQQNVDSNNQGETEKRTRYLTRTLALLKLQSRFRKSRSEDTDEPGRRLTDRLNSVISPNKSLSSASLCCDLATMSNPAVVPGTIDEVEPFILGIHVHNTDRKLKSSKSVIHPVVKIHVVDSSTGCYLVKKHPDRDVASYYETVNSKINFILPVMTQNCDLLTRIRYPRYPIWEELLLYNEDYSYFLKDNVIIFFEILDFITFSGHSERKYFSMKRNEWWYRIAWAFLTLKSSDGSYNTERKLRLQLYKPLSQKVSIDPRNPHTTELFEWWQSNKLLPFPGSIYVTISPIPLILNRETFSPVLRSYGPLQPEKSNEPYSRSASPISGQQQYQGQSQGQGQARRSGSSGPISKSLDTSLDGRLSGSLEVIWSRLEGQPCKVPKNLWHQFSAGNNKCSYAIRFSRDGRKVACGASVFTAYRSNEKRSSIFIYEIPSGRFLKRVNGFHSGAIYEIDWSPNDRYLVSASSDCTAHVWNNLKEYQSSIMLPHPCFVYSARFHLNRSGIVFTGSYDGLIRIWCIKLSLESTAVEPQLVQEIDCFYGQVLSLAWKAETFHGNQVATLFASGSKGELVMLSQRDPASDFTWYLRGSIVIKEIIDVPVNNIAVHPFAAKILIFCRDGVQRMVDYQLEIVVQRFTGTLNFHHLIRGCLSPCGRFVFAGGEDSLVHVWNADTGERLFTYSDLPFKGPISCVEYHPFDHIIAICGLNARTISVCLFKHETLKSPTKVLNPGDHGLSVSTRCVSPGRRSKEIANSNKFTRSKTIDQSSVSESGAIRRGNFKVQRAMRKLESALRTKSIEKKQ